MKREFFFQDDTSNKFWTIEITGTQCTTANGRAGAKPRETHKSFPLQKDAEKFFNQQIAAKLKAGYKEGIAPPYVKPDWSLMTMSEDVFWRVIALFRWQKTGDDDAVIEPAVAALSQMNAQDIYQFEEILSHKLYQLDTLAHASNIGDESYKPDEYFSADWFLYVRCCVVANGKELYEEALADPKEMPKDMDFEPILYVASTAYDRKTNAEDEFSFSPSLSYETYSNRDGWPRS